MSNVRFKVRFKTISFNKDKFLADYKEGMKKLIKNAAVDFAIFAEMQIPVDTGMAKSTLLGKVNTIEGSASTAKAYLGLNDSPANINVVSQIQRTRKDTDKSKYWNGIFPEITDSYKRTPSAGRQRGLYDFRTDGKKIVFSFFPSVRHYLYHENRWRSMEAGRNAFRSYIATHSKRFVPKLKKYYTISYKTVGA